MMKTDGPLTVFRRTWNEFLQETSIAGLANSGKSRNGVVRRIFWQIAFIVMFSISLKQIIEVVKDYYDYPVTTTVTVNNQEKIFFPAVTICNQNRINCCNLTLTIDLCTANYTICGFSSSNDTQFETLNFLKEKCDSEDGNRRKRELPPPQGEEGGEGHGGDNGEEPPPEDYGEQTGAAKDEALFLAEFMGLSSHVRKLIGHDFNDFIKMCTFRGASCLESKNFLVENYPVYGNCYIFNSNQNTDDALAGKRTLALTGPTFGLSLVLNLNQKYYLKKGATQKGGARVTVHDNELRPLVDEDGLDVKQWTSTEVAIQELVINRQKTPYTSECMGDFNETGYTKYINREKSGRYSIAECKRACFFHTVIEVCDCFHPLFLDFEENANGHHPCNLTQYTTEGNCTEKVVYEIDLGIRRCSCGVGCLDRHYVKRLSVATWPAKQYLNDAAAAYGFTGNGNSEVCSWTNVTTTALPTTTQATNTANGGDNQNNDGSNDQSNNGNGDSGNQGRRKRMLNIRKKRSPPSEQQQKDLAENLLRVDVYFETLSVQNITETPKYDAYSFLSSLGGAASLFLGLALFMVLEVIEFIIDLCINLFAYCATGRLDS